jgi:hypothetical protein
MCCSDQVSGGEATTAAICNLVAIFRRRTAVRVESRVQARARGQTCQQFTSHVRVRDLIISPIIRPNQVQM